MRKARSVIESAPTAPFGRGSDRNYCGAGSSEVGRTPSSARDPLVAPWRVRVNHLGPTRASAADLGVRPTSECCATGRGCERSSEPGPVGSGWRSSSPHRGGLRGRRRPGACPTRLLIASLLSAAFILTPLARAEIIDRIAVTVDKEIITESELRLTIRVTAFLNGEALDFSPAARRASAERLIDQALIRREMRLTRYPDPDAEEVDQRLKAAKALYPREGEYAAALEKYGITEADLLDALKRQVAVLHFIDLRFAPEVQVLEPELMEYFYRVCVPKFKERAGAGNIGFDEYRNDCEEIMVAERVDQRVETWLKDARARARIRFQEDAFS